MPDATADLLFRPVDELAGLVRTGDVTSRELVDASLERIDALNPDLNAFIQLDAERARETADAIGPDDPRPFAGVPVAIKENRAVDGLRLSFGSDLFGDFRAQIDANVTRRLREAGFVIVGQTNLPEFGILPVSESRRFGPARNPWDNERTPGGSSGGSAAAVASGMGPVAHANDGGGSTRIPAACCGLVGLKPARGRISCSPELGESFLVVDGELTRTVRETAALLDVLAGPELGDASWAPPPAESFAAAAAREPGRLRVAFTLTPPIDCPVDVRYDDAVRATASLLESLGHEVEEVAPPWSIPELTEIFTAVFCGNIALSILFGAMVSQTTPGPETIEPLSEAVLEIASGINAQEYLAALYELQGFGRAFMQWQDPYDVLLTPALAQAPVRIGEIDACSDDPLDAFNRAGEFTPFTVVFNATGQPAISLPLFHGDDGLPTGVQLVGRQNDEATLLSVGSQLEAALPWSGRRAPV